jgi:hypothetical protein
VQGQGTAQSPVTLTSFWDDSVGGDTDRDDGTTVPAPGDWGGIRVNGGGTLNLVHATVSYGDDGVQLDGGSATVSNSRFENNVSDGLLNQGGTLAVTGSIVANNGASGLQHQSGSSTIHTSSITGNASYGVFNADTATVLDATNNWWGDASGPAPYGTGNGINYSGCPQHCVYYVNAVPWLTSPTGPALSLHIDAPTALSLVGVQYSPNPFSVVATVTNTGVETATTVALTLALPGGLSFVHGSSTQAVGDIAPGQHGQVTWTVQAAGQAQNTTLSYTVSDTSSNAATSHSVQQITLPGGGLTITSITPNVGGDAGSVTAIITGGAYPAGTTVSLVRSGHTDIVGTGVGVASDGTSVTATFDLTGQSDGPWDVRVTRPDGASATLADGFTIEAGGAPGGWVSIIGRTFVAPHRPTALLTCGAQLRPPPAQSSVADPGTSSGPC